MAMMPAGVEFVRPEWLWLYAAFMALGLFLKASASGRQVRTSSIDSASRDAYVYHPFAHYLNTLQAQAAGRGVLNKLVFWLALALLVLALAQPERVGEKLPDPLPERDIIFIVDASVSMTLRDYIVDGERVSRMTVVKGVLDEFASKLKGSRLSVVVFGEQAYTYVPLTRDHEFTRKMFARMESTMAGRFNAMGDGIALAVKNVTENKTQHTVLVLLTDADRATGTITPENAALLARQENLPLYTIAIGAASSAAEEQRISGLIYQPVNLDLLENMSSQTGAKSYRAGATIALKEAIADIERREQRSVVQPPRYYRQSLYYWLLLPGMLLLGMLSVIKLVTGCRR
jgi:Ca-activated chloride channel family protein